MSGPDVTGFYHEDTGTVSYVAVDPGSGEAAIIDAVLDFDYNAARTSTASADALVDFVERQGYRPTLILDTHVHADHPSAAGHLRDRLDVPMAIGWRLPVVQETWKDLLGLEADLPADGSQYDYLIEDGGAFSIGGLQGRALHTPGHTPACMSWVIGDAVFVGDTIFMPDFGTARCDFPGGSARDLFRSIRRLFDLPEDTRVFCCHDYGPGGRDPAWETTIGAEKRDNVHVGGDADEDSYVKMREERDAGLSLPRLIIPSLQINVRGGRLPPAEADGVSYLRVPLNRM